MQLFFYILIFNDEKFIQMLAEESMELKLRKRFNDSDLLTFTTGELRIKLQNTSILTP